MTTKHAQSDYDAAKAAAAAQLAEDRRTADRLCVYAANAYTAAMARAFADLTSTATTGPFGHNDQGNITYRGIAYAASSLGTTPLGLERAAAFAAWLNARVAEDEERS